MKWECPNCFKEDVEEYDLIDFGETVERIFHCDECGIEFKVIYDIVDVQMV